MADLLNDLDALLQQRKREQPADSYSVTLVTDPVLAQRKIMEEAFEVCLEIGAAEVDVERAAAEAADLVFHLMAGLTGAGVTWDQVMSELSHRRR